MGEDFPVDALEKFELAGLTTEFMIPIVGPTVRNWVIYEWDGSRTWLYRTEKTRSLEVSPEPEDITEAALDGVGVAHIAAMPLANAERLVARLREMAPEIRIVLDTHEDWIEGYQGRVIALARRVNYFVPSKEELIILMETPELELAMAKLSTHDIENIIVKAGAQGAFLLGKHGHQHVTARDHAFGAFPQILTLTHSDVPYLRPSHMAHCLVRYTTKSLSTIDGCVSIFSVIL